MQLEKGEHSILSYFPSSTKAKRALEHLYENGVIPSEEYAQIDRISRYSFDENDEIENPLNNAISLSGLTLKSDEGTSPLLAASDSASGFGNPDAGVAGGEAFLLTLVTKKENLQTALQIVKANGGKV